jgi:hypothetical protein
VTDLARPRVAGGIPLVPACGRIETIDDAGGTIAVGEPTVVLEWIPD